MWQAWDYAVEKLGGQLEAKREAQLMVAHILGCSPSRLPLLSERIVDLDKLNRLIEMRQAGKPLQYILGEQEFMSLAFYVEKTVLIPRADTERIVETAINLFAASDNQVDVADICCGSGAIGVSLAYFLPRAHVLATDISEQALQVAQKNAVRHRVQNRMTFLQGDLLQPLQGKSFDLIVCNPPYIPHEDLATLPPDVQKEPQLALDGGADGLDFYRRLAKDAAACLQPQGYLLLEMGFDQKDMVTEICAQQGWQVLREIQDYGQNHRGLLLQPFDSINKE